MYLTNAFHPGSGAKHIGAVAQTESAEGAITVTIDGFAWCVVTGILFMDFSCVCIESEQTLIRPAPTVGSTDQGYESLCMS